ncbi:SDR family oxidoreductase [Skermanella mucosa]|uniref:SDR family NAD(P)-dependent oxidoreductase n=1 Tax=Skermanella mucosa TaxID=1789672 RepID=UPI00192BED50|nr:SDR family oxidoreductase [Skermanella mucosa]UEM21075.1 SDR family oxidoreductase [Skermanella mucosa]
MTEQTPAISAFDISGRRALVTGGTSGIGAAIAAGLADAGCHVIAAGLPVADAAPDPTGPIQTVDLDVTDAQAVERLAKGLDRLDILVNAAGIIRRGAEFDLDAFEQVVDVNLTGTMRLCTACRPLLARQGGSIVNVASMLSFFGGGLVPAYSASKGGIAQLTKSLAIAWAMDGIRVNAIAPGWIATALTQGLQEDPARSEAILSRTPLKRWGTPQDLTGAVVFLCSPAAAFVTGTVLPVDGGYLIS